MTNLDVGNRIDTGAPRLLALLSDERPREIWQLPEHAFDAAPDIKSTTRNQKEISGHTSGRFFQRRSVSATMWTRLSSCGKA
jgi:hypothetical protein